MASKTHAPDSRLYFRQLLAGRDFAKGDPIASQMVNFVYLIGDRDTKECLIVDPAWSVGELVRIANADGMKVTGALATHYHQDHVGGDLFGTEIDGIRELIATEKARVHCQKDEVEWIRRVTGVEPGDLVAHGSGDVVKVGQIPITLIHTPGHTPGSQCFLVAGKLVAGDTLFLKGCGRTDLPGGDAEALYYSLTQRLAQIPDDTVLYPGHLYDVKGSASMGETRRENFVLQVKSLQDWLRMM